jgi:ribose transport system substrate-binding protein
LVAALVAMATLLLVVLLAVAQNALSGPPVIVRPTLVAGSIGTAEDVVPTDAEIALANRVMNGEGFIAYIACLQNSEYHATQAREMNDLAERYGLDFRVYDSASDPYREITLIERARVDGASALIVCPLDPGLLSGALTSVQESGIPLVFLASDMPTYGGVLLSGDDYQMGLKAGRAGGDLINDLFDGQGRILVLEYPDLAYVVNRVNGLVSGALEIAPDSEIVDRRLGGIIENGYASVKAALEEGVSFNTILSLNDAGSIGAIQALEEAGVDPASVVISSVDAEAPARQHIRDGHYLRASVSVNRLLFAQVAINTVVKLLAGSGLPETLVVAPGTVITAENVDSAS